MAKTGKAPQAFVHQTPRYENQVIGRKSKIIRPDKRKKKKWY
jgi:hypothetical protein